MDIKQLRHFECVFRHASFVKASTELGITQSALTKSIQAFEVKLGEKLFDRTTHSVRPTAIGENLLPYARDVIASHKVFEQQSGQLQSLSQGMLTVGAGPYPLRSLVTPAIAVFAQTHPDIDVKVRTGGSSDLLNRLVNRELDMVISDIGKFETFSLSNQVQSQTLPSEPLVIVHPKGHPIAGQDLYEANAANYAWALPKSSPYFQRVLAPYVKDAEQEFPRYEIESLAACLDLVKTAGALTAIPQSMADNMSMSSNVSSPNNANQDFYYMPLPAGFETHMAIHTLRGRTLSPAAKLLKTILSKNDPNDY